MFNKMLPLWYLQQCNISGRVAIGQVPRLTSCGRPMGSGSGNLSWSQFARPLVENEDHFSSLVLNEGQVLI